MIYCISIYDEKNRYENRVPPRDLLGLLIDLHLGRLRGQRLAGDRLRGGRVRRGGGRGAAVRRRRLEVGLTRLLRLGTWDGGWDKYIYI